MRSQIAQLVPNDTILCYTPCYIISCHLASQVPSPHIQVDACSPLFFDASFTYNTGRRANYTWTLQGVVDITKDSTARHEKEITANDGRPTSASEQTTG